MPALQHFFDAERKRRGWSVREIARLAKISSSKAYAIVNGDDNVEFETFENIAAAFSMSPAELAVAIGKGPATADPRRAPIHAVLRDVPDEQLGTVEVMLRGLAVEPTRRAKTRTTGAANSLQPARFELPDGADVGEPRPSKRRQFVIPELSTFREHAVQSLQSLLAAFGLNRDSGRAAAAA